MVRLCSRIVGLLLPGLLLLLAPASAYALSVRVPLPGLLGEYPPGGEIRVVEWDVGVKFAEIEDTVLLLEADGVSELLIVGFNAIPGTAVQAGIYTTPENRPPLFSGGQLRHQGVGAPALIEIRPQAPVGDAFHDPNATLAEKILALISPDLTAFFDGRALLELEFTIADPERSPGTITSAQLTVVGTPIPEPSTFLLVVGGLAALALRRRRGLLLVLGLALSPAVQPAQATESAPVTITLETSLWLISEVPDQRPSVPMVQEIRTWPHQFTQDLTLTPGLADATAATLPADLAGGGTTTYSRTTDGSPILFPNPTNRFDTLPLRIALRANNRPGRAARMQGGWMAEALVDLQVFLSFGEATGPAGPVFTARFDLPGAIGDPSVGTELFEGEIAPLSIPLDGTAIPNRFTDGPVTVGKLFLRGRGQTQTFETLMFSAAGSSGRERVSLVSPFVIDVFVGEGPERNAVSILGFLTVRAQGEGVTFTPEPTGLLFVALGLVGVVAWWRHRGLTR